MFRNCLVLGVSLLLAWGVAHAQERRELDLPDPTPAELEAAYHRALELSPTPLTVRARWSHWTGEEAPGGLPDGPIPLELIQKHYLEVQAARDARVATENLPDPAALQRGCVAPVVDHCVAISGGFLTVGGHLLHWQLQDEHGRASNSEGGFVVWSGETLRPVAWASAKWGYDPPLLIDDGAYVVFRSQRYGNSANKPDMIFRWEPGADHPLVQIDNLSWKRDLRRLLPKDTIIWENPAFIYDHGSVSVGLGRAGDPRIDGEALVSFSIVDDQLVVELIRANPTGRLRDLP